MSRIGHAVINRANDRHYEEKHGYTIATCKHWLCRLAMWIHTSPLSPYPDTCSLCGRRWYPSFFELGYVWLCPGCRHPKKECECGSDDVTLNWDIVNDQNGELSPGPVWSVECGSCERMTPYFETAREAAEAWDKGQAEVWMR